MGTHREEGLDGDEAVQQWETEFQKIEDFITKEQRAYGHLSRVSRATRSPERETGTSIINSIALADQMTRRGVPVGDYRVHRKKAFDPQSGRLKVWSQEDWIWEITGGDPQRFDLATHLWSRKFIKLQEFLQQRRDEPEGGEGIGRSREGEEPEPERKPQEGKGSR